MLLNRKDFLIALYKSGDVFVGVVMTADDKSWVKAVKADLINLVRKSEDNVGPYKVDISEHGNLYVG
jgi:hypothetical protein